ncbi:amylo-alpha-1,6-glucosidase [Taklimakanibacter lacteus]|uniref:amylo-alpha-1,6-glucosidase n=1 Tax=Taklimakanibacter lacteus TaxID=2268456 RepID=UPI000E65F57B
MTVPNYLRTPNIPASRAWNSWAADRYLEMSHLPLGVKVTPVFYAASTGKTTLMGPGSDIRLGRHEPDGSLIEANFSHGGTHLDWTWRKTSTFGVAGSWKAARFGEWGLRFWVVLALSQNDGALWHYDEESRTAFCTVGPRTVAIRAKHDPLLVTGHETLDALRSEYETNGYWYLASRSSAAKVLALRFNLEEAPENDFAISIADRKDQALAQLARLPSPAKATSRGAALDAMADIMGWNTIWDSVNHRPYITCSRNWDLKKFGGFGFWLNDTAINAFLVAQFDPDQARENLAMLLSAATPQGNLPCIMTGNDAWVDRTQTPVISFIVWQIYLRTGSRLFIDMAYEILARNNEWIRSARDGNGNGILEFGSSDVGQGLYKGTKLAAKDESFMDNSPIHDEARWNEKSRTLDVEDVGLNCLVCLDCEMLAHMARALGRVAEAKKHDANAASLRKKIGTHFWDEKRNIFANRLWSGGFAKSVAPTSFYPLLCGAASKQQQKHLVKHLEDPAKFGGEFGLPSVSRDDPALADNVYWRGRIWPILNWLVWNGLERAGEYEAADRLIDRSWHLFTKSWNERRLSPENYHPGTGEGLDQPDTDPFYSWSALLPFLQQARVMSFSPWQGWQLRNEGKDFTVGPVETPLGAVTIARKKGTLTLARGEEALFTTDKQGRISGPITPA